MLKYITPIAHADFDPTTYEGPKTFAGLIARLVGLIDIITGILVGVAVIVFFWGLVQFLFAVGDEKKIEDGKHKIGAGLIGIFVIIAVWGLVKVVISIFSLA